MRTGERYTDEQFCRAELRGGIYGLTVGGLVYALTENGRAVLLPPSTAKAWRELPLQEPPAIGDGEPWTLEDELAAERAGCA